MLLDRGWSDNSHYLMDANEPITLTPFHSSTLPGQAETNHASVIFAPFLFLSLGIVILAEASS